MSRWRVLGRGKAIFATVVLFTAVVVVVLLKGCTVTVAPPLDVQDPVDVYLLDYGRHPGVVLARSDHEFVEYSYGEWEWFALNRNSWADVFRALFINSDGTLGRRVIHVVPGEPWWEQIPFAALHRLTVEREYAGSLLSHLDQRWDAGRENAVYNAHHGLEFVPDPQDYSLFDNSNIVVAHWLAFLGCEVRGWPLYPIDWRIAEPAHRRQPRPQSPHRLVAEVAVEASCSYAPPTNAISPD